MEIGEELKKAKKKKMITRGGRWAVIKKKGVYDKCIYTMRGQMCVLDE